MLFRSYATQTTEAGESDLQPIAPEQLEGFMQALKMGNPNEFVAVYADEEVNYGKIVEILDKGSKQGVKIVLATKPSEASLPSADASEAASEPQTIVDVPVPVNP